MDSASTMSSLVRNGELGVSALGPIKHTEIRHPGTTMHRSTSALTLLHLLTYSNMSSKIKIWGRINSNNVKKAIWIAEELGLDYESVIVGGQYGGTKTPEYLALNPNSTIPTIQDEDFTLWESNAIVRYLANAYSTAKASLWIDDAKKRASGDKWMDWTSSSFSPAFRPIMWGLVRTPPDQQDHNEINAAVVTCNTLLSMADAALAKQDYLSGDQFGIADIPLGTFIYVWYELKIARDKHRHLEAWYERLKARPAYQKAIMTKIT